MAKEKTKEPEPVEPEGEAYQQEYTQVELMAAQRAE